MKILSIFAVLVFLGIINSQAQNHSDKIEIEKGFKYHDIYLDRHEVKMLLKKDKQAYDLFKPSRFTHTMSFLLFSVGLGTAVAPLQAKIDNNDDTKPTHTATFVGVGLGLIVLGFPVRNKSYRQTKAAVELYNSRLSSNLHQRPKPEFLLGSTGKGLGMAIKF